MKILRAIALVGLVVAVAGCSRMVSTPTVSQAPQMPQTAGQTMNIPNMTPDQTTASSDPIQQARLDPGRYDYIDGAAKPLLADAQLSAANDAQFYALQFGRPGAPRNWSSGGASGQVSVGPYVRVNNLDCREFSHRVTVNGQTYTKSGQACREVDGAWNVTA